MRYGSLFTGIGGLDLAVEHVTGAVCAWQAEREPYRRAVLRRWWPGVPCFDDVADVGPHAPAVDLVCGGFMCTDVSNAGPRTGLAGERSGGTWGHFGRVLRILRPRFAFVENVAALTGRGLDAVLVDLAALGFDAEWTTLRASDAGAPHDRDRIWILAYADRHGLRELAERDQRTRRGERTTLGGNPLSLDDRAEVAEVARLRHASEGAGRGGWSTEAVGEHAGGGAQLADADHDGREGCSARHDHDGRDAPGHDDARRGALALLAAPDWPPDRAASPDAWRAWLERCAGREPGVRRGAYGPPRGLDARRRRARLAALGDAVCPHQAVLALRELIVRACS